MTNRSKAKGTAGETELRNLLCSHGLTTHRTLPGTLWDLETRFPRTYLAGSDDLVPHKNIVATRPDHGKWLVSMDLADFLDFYRDYNGNDYNLHIEVKRAKSMWLHTVYNAKFGPPRKLEVS